ncbi:hypothetical protein P8452_39018 [Trifolium repens]|nr:hypothetical protein P8452_39018 [Trifolium repens]
MNNSRRTGMSTLRGYPCRRSVEDLSPFRRSRSIFSGSSGVSHSEPLDRDDYSDVFGGPPRSLLVHRFSSSDCLYDEIYRLPKLIPPAEKVDMTLPVFRIPARNDGFFSDIFGSDDDRKSRDRSGSLSKANSSSALSSEELSPCRPTIGDDVPLFASKLRRPMSVPWKLNSSTMMSEEYPKINSNLKREDCEASDIDEAIAWAKEKFQSGSSDEESSMGNNGNDKTVQEQGSRDASEYHPDEIVKVQHPKKQRTDTEKLDENIRMWSSSKESDIRLLLSTLHHILWPESGWHTIPLVNLIEKSQVKRAYQKARLCLHPDKLQQKGATVLHKYVAEQAFSILQDAWAAFISEDVSF